MYSIWAWPPDSVICWGVWASGKRWRWFCSVGFAVVSISFAKSHECDSTFPHWTAFWNCWRISAILFRRAPRCPWPPSRRLQDTSLLLSKLCSSSETNWMLQAFAAASFQPCRWVPSRPPCCCYGLQLTNKACLSSPTAFSYRASCFLEVFLSGFHGFVGSFVACFGLLLYFSPTICFEYWLFMVCLAFSFRFSLFWCSFPDHVDYLTPATIYSNMKVFACCFAGC